jgi:hypothetical protein
MKVHILREKKRDCGYRKAGKNGVGIYLMGTGYSEPCERLVFPLETCPCCGAGIKFSRGWTWIDDPSLLFAPDRKPICDPAFDHAHLICPVCTPHADPAGLLWIGEKNYTPTAFIEEAQTMGVSRRLQTIPRGVEFGKTWVYLAHIKAFSKLVGETNYTLHPGIFYVFRLTHADLVIEDENDIPGRAKALKEKHGDNARIVKVIPDGQD